MSALAAVLVRDLRGAERGGLLGSARAISLAGAALFVLALFAGFDAATSVDVPRSFALLVGGLMLLTLIFAASFALGAFRTERRAGTLDLLFLSGLRPRTLALGRWLSCFFVLQTIAAAALPALSLFWFFRSPSPRAWLLHAVALTCWNAGVAALGTAISAWSRRPGTAIAAGLIVLPAFAALSLTSAAMSGWSAPGLVFATMKSEGALAVSRVSLCLGLHAALVAAAVLLSARGLERHRPDAALDLAKASKGLGGPSERLPLSWLLQRSSPAARPGAQLLALTGLLALIGVGAVAAPWLGGSTVDVLSAQALSVIGGGIALLSIAAALAAGSTRIAAERESRTWDTIASSARTSDKIFGDLIESTLRCCLLPFLLGALVLLLAELMRGVAILEALMPAISLLASLLLVSVLGLAASACAHSSAAALALGCLLALGVPALVAGGHSLGAGQGPDAGAGLGFLTFIGVMGLPLLVRGLGPFLLALLVTWRGREKNPRGPGRLITRPLLVLVPLAILSGAMLGSDDSAWASGYGGLHAALVHLATFGEERSLLDPSVLVRGALWQLLFALLVLHGIWRQRDLWLGRAST